MCFFLNEGVNRQLNSTTETEADKNFKISCRICCNRGIHMDCEHCPIASANEQQKSAILDARKIERQRKQRAYEEKQKIENLVASATEIYSSVRCPRDIEEASDELEKLADAFLIIKLRLYEEGNYD